MSTPCENILHYTRSDLLARACHRYNDALRLIKKHLSKVVYHMPQPKLKHGRGMIPIAGSARASR
jgi:hypothetical protein